MGRGTIVETVNVNIYGLYAGLTDTRLEKQQAFRVVAGGMVVAVDLEYFLVFIECLDYFIS